MIESWEMPFEISGTRIFLPFQAICTLTDKPFGGQVVIEYTPKTKALEYVDAERYLEGLTQNKVTAEELTDKVFNEVEKSISPQYLKVMVDVNHSEAHQPVQVWKERKSMI